MVKSLKVAALVLNIANAENLKAKKDIKMSSKIIYLYFCQY